MKGQGSRCVRFRVQGLRCLLCSRSGFSPVTEGPPSPGRCSAVTISSPLAANTGIRHELTDFQLETPVSASVQETITAHAPHRPSPHAVLVLCSVRAQRDGGSG